MAFLNITEAYFLNPHILGRNAHVNPILVIFALLAGRHVGGLVGALLAVPIASVAVALFGYIHDRITSSYTRLAPTGTDAAEG
jgi:predicted PurR-regulated permease PerM